MEKIHQSAKRNKSSQDEKAKKLKKSQKMRGITLSSLHKHCEESNIVIAETLKKPPTETE